MPELELGLELEPELGLELELDPELGLEPVVALGFGEHSPLLLLLFLACSQDAMVA